MSAHVMIRRKGFILNPLSSPLWTCLLVFDTFSGACYNWELMFLHCFSDAAFSVNSLNSFSLLAIFSFSLNFSAQRESSICQLHLRLGKNLVVGVWHGEVLGKEDGN